MDIQTDRKIEEVLYEKRGIERQINRYLVQLTMKLC